MSKTLWATSLPRRGNLSCPPDGAPLGIGHGVVTGLLLLGDREWVEVAVVVLDIVKHQHRRNLATWVPLIQTIDKMIPLINESAQINEAVFELQDILRVVNDPRDARFAREEIQRIAKDTPALHDAALRHWQNTYEGIMALPQKCMQTAQLHQWEHPYAQHGPVNDREHKT